MLIERKKTVMIIVNKSESKVKTRFNKKRYYLTWTCSLCCTNEIMIN